MFIVYSTGQKLTLSVSNLLENTRSLHLMNDVALSTRRCSYPPFSLPSYCFKITIFYCMLFPPLLPVSMFTNSFICCVLILFMFLYVLLYAHWIWTSFCHLTRAVIIYFLFGMCYLICKEQKKNKNTTDCGTDINGVLPRILFRWLSQLSILLSLLLTLTIQIINIRKLPFSSASLK